VLVVQLVDFALASPIAFPIALEAALAKAEALPLRASAQALVR